MEQDSSEPRGLWITWEKQIRNIGLSRAFGYSFLQIDIPGNPLKRYFHSFLRTFSSIFKLQPEVLVAQNPSIILALYTLFLRSFFKYVLVIDAHNSGIYPFGSRYKILNALSRHLQKKADYTIVTNNELTQVVKANGGNAGILPDKLPAVPENIYAEKLDGKQNVVFVCSYHDDEPYNEVIKAAALINPDFVIYITGNHKNRFASIKLPDNIKLTGFLSENDYWKLLKSADIIMDLTTRENCLVCGAYEATALIKPMVLSNTQITKQYFNQGCTYADPNAESIASCINQICNNLNFYNDQVNILKENIEKKWNDHFEICKKNISELIKTRTKM